MEANLIAARHEVDEEIRLASEQKAHHGRELQRLECGKNERHRSDQRNDLTAIRSQQLMDMAEERELQVQKAVKKEGTLPMFTAPLETENMSWSSGSGYRFSV